MKTVTDAIVIGANEESGIWDILTDIADINKITRSEALILLKGEIPFLLNQHDIYFVKSKILYDTDTCEVLDKVLLTTLNLEDVEFREGGPFYYLSNVPSI